jgi:hypothetical protein
MPLLLSVLLALTILASGGCSRVSIAYNTADFFIEQYADDYLALDSSQMAAWRPSLRDALARHREDELPYLAAFFDGMNRAASKGFDAPTVECLIDSFEQVYRRHFRLATDLAAPLLASLTPEQIRHLERKFAADAEEETREDGGSVERRKRKRAERWSKSATWWIGPLSDRQREIIRAVTASMPDTAADWASYRSTKQTDLIRLLRDQAGEEEIRRYLADWLVEYADLYPQLRQARLEIRRQVVALFLRLDATFSPEQRAHFEDRLTALRDDFMGLQPHPRMAATRCSHDHR